MFRQLVSILSKVVDKDESKNRGFLKQFCRSIKDPECMLALPSCLKHTETLENTLLEVDCNLMNKMVPPYDYWRNNSVKETKSFFLCGNN